MQGECTPVSNLNEGLIDGNQRTRHGRTSGPARRSTRGQWTAEEDEILRTAVERFKGKNWKKIAECFKDRTDVQCLHRWQKVLNPELVKGPWTKEEDDMIIQLVHKYGPKKWSTIARYLPGRIGKQCRERWHNHLNPSINKEAWTQEEELILIRAHQIYGNRWAELTKFLPGRTDNGIKNHWHSSVKKKLDSYLASGLLDQYQALPVVPFQKSSMFSSSGLMQRTTDDSGCSGGLEEKEPESSSQNSSTAGYSLSATDFPGLSSTGQHFHTSENPCENEHATLAAYNLDRFFYPELEDIAATVSEVSCEMEDSSKFPDHSVVTSSSQDCQFSLQDLPDIASLELRQEISELSTIYMNEGIKSKTPPVQTSSSLQDSISMPSMDIASYQHLTNLLISDGECSGVLFTNQENKELYVSGSLLQEPKVADPAEHRDSSLCSSSSDNQISEATKTLALQSCSSRFSALAAPCKETLRPTPLIISSDKCTKESARLICHPFEVEPKCGINAKDSFIYIDVPTNSPCANEETETSGQKDQSYHVNDSKKLVPVNDFASLSDVKRDSPPIKCEPDVNKEMQHEDLGASCHESLCFPSLDLSFFSCDLTQSKNDLLQDYSPLGMRKLLMSTVTCMSPLRPWDSPTRDHSPGAVLKAGKKTFVGAQSILKKRNRELLTPLSERRSDKKLGTDITSSLARDFSRLDVMFGESGDQESSLSSPTSISVNYIGASHEDKENCCRALNVEHEENGKDKSSLLSSRKMSVENIHCRNSLKNGEQACSESNTEAKDVSEPAAQNDESIYCVLPERNTNKQVPFSPDQSISRAEKSQVSTPGSHLHRTLMVTSNKEHSSASLCLVINSPSRIRNMEDHLVDSSTSNIANDNLSILCGTPFRRSLESPSAWKSPLFINSIFCSPRFDTEMTLEDIGYIFSPGDRNYNAVGLMKHPSEHKAEASTDVKEVPSGDEAPKKSSRHTQMNKDNENARGVQEERRVLDFTDCESPVKSINFKR
ncbi:PREDICTED: myb-related protein 3R-1 [Tarenaya hassleriana]|uniref:myb-related protein 3R-1 n=1 Tax=Tarenaya hassleriana TaxID=28532 RepID=UPI00053C64B3|nr:PREDICTED: myb-related protein 3R-1 [Tarenaya hassleriana]XP_010519902.1 PREDICTED: myb-related protein 3R-1 [Tarenaya hassleriana]XP_010519903.1 PREDICTED: myb-related protein 3R-1 [Tarenaya hassleriana]XP_010519904.1 PREDICTED: myb-related protein 3R-1 [Tarenaya hassleriana]